MSWWWRITGTRLENAPCSPANTDATDDLHDEDGPDHSALSVPGLNNDTDTHYMFAAQPCSNGSDQPAGPSSMQAISRLARRGAGVHDSPPAQQVY